MASDVVGCALLAALGVKNLSVQPDSVHHVRHAISKLDVTALQKDLPAMFDLESADDVEQRIKLLCA